MEIIACASNLESSGFLPGIFLCLPIPDQIMDPSLSRQSGHRTIPLPTWRKRHQFFDQFQARESQASSSSSECSGSPRSASPSSPLLSRGVAAPAAGDSPPGPGLLRETDTQLPREVWTESQVLDMLDQVGATCDQRTPFLFVSRRWGENNVSCKSLPSQHLQMNSLPQRPFFQFSCPSVWI